MEKIKLNDLSDIQVGDKLIRNLAGMDMRVIVGQVTETQIKVGSDDRVIPWQIGWTFDRATCAEVDEDLEWGPDYNRSGSHITHKYTD